MLRLSAPKRVGPSCERRMRMKIVHGPEMIFIKASILQGSLCLVSFSVILSFGFKGLGDLQVTYSYLLIIHYLLTYIEASHVIN